MFGSGQLIGRTPKCKSQIRGLQSQKHMKERAVGDLSAFCNRLPSEDLFAAFKLDQNVFPVFSVVIFLFLTSCFSPSPLPIERVRPKQPDPIKQRECQQRGRNDCEGYKDCEEICDDIFSRRRDKQECYEYSSEMVFQFEDLISATEDGEVDEIEDIGSGVLECMLDIDESAFAKAIRKMSRREAQDFALLIAENEDFAEVLEDEDDEFNVLKQLINSLAGSSELEEALSQEIESDKTTLWLFAEYNESAWDWLNGYVEEECDGRDTEDCPGGENIGAYCNVLLESGFSRNDWEDFLSDTDLFAHDYEEEVEDADYEYKITDSPERDYNGDFRDYCKLIVNASDSNPPDDPSPPGENSNLDPCPTGSPEAGQILTNIQLEANNTIDGNDWRYYRHPDAEAPTYGSANPTQNILLFVSVLTSYGHDQIKGIWLNADLISHDSKRTYYFYINSVRYRLRVPDPRARTSGRVRYIHYPINSSFSAPEIPTNTVAVAIASELNGDQCEFYTP